MSIDRNLAFDFGFAVAKRTGALLGNRPEDRESEEAVMQTTIDRVSAEGSMSQQEAVQALQARYNQVCSRTEHNPIERTEDGWAYRQHCRSCGIELGVEPTPGPVDARCEDCTPSV